MKTNLSSMDSTVINSQHSVKMFFSPCGIFRIKNGKLEQSANLKDWQVATNPPANVSDWFISNK